MIQAYKIAVEAGWRILDARVEHIGGTRTSVEGIQSPDRTYHETVSLGATDAWMLVMLPATHGKSQ